MIETSGLNHIALPVADPERSAEFYAELFNMVITFRSREVSFLKTDGERDMIALSCSDSILESARDGFHFGFMVSPEQYDRALQTIEEKQIKKVSEPSHRPIGRYVFVEDPDGYVVEVFECLTQPFA